jgi:hypothetical protein
VSARAKFRGKRKLLWRRLRSGFSRVLLFSSCAQQVRISQHFSETLKKCELLSCPSPTPLSLTLQRLGCYDCSRFRPVLCQRWNPHPSYSDITCDGPDPSNLPKYIDEIVWELCGLKEVQLEFELLWNILSVGEEYWEAIAGYILHFLSLLSLTFLSLPFLTPILHSLPFLSPSTFLPMGAPKAHVKDRVFLPILRQTSPCCSHSWMTYPRHEDTASCDPNTFKFLPTSRRLIILSEIGTGSTQESYSFRYTVMFRYSLCGQLQVSGPL